MSSTPSLGNVPFKTRHLVPHKSGVHRFACRYLYKSLLCHCSQLPIAQQYKDGLQSVLRAHFKAQRSLKSPGKIAMALKAGYKLVDLLRCASQRDRDALVRLSSIIHSASVVETSPLRTRPLSSTSSQSRIHIPQDALQASAVEKKSLPYPVSVFQRPLPASALSGRRRVPVLANARGIPFLRLKKPQPPRLGRMLRSLLNRRRDLWDTYEGLEARLPLCEDEDEWDRIVAEKNELLRDPAAEPWTTAQAQSRTIWVHKVQSFNQKTSQTAMKMAKIVELEKQLAMSELTEEERRQIERRKRWRGNRGHKAFMIKARKPPEITEKITPE